MRKKEKLPQLTDWFVELPSFDKERKVDSGILITESMVLNSNLNLPFCKNDNGAKYLHRDMVGKIGNKRKKLKGIQNFEDGIVKTSTGEKFQVLEKNVHPDYAWFEMLVNRNMPILYNYVFGRSWDNRTFVAGNMYEDGEISTIFAEVAEQNFENFYLVLKNGKIVFVNWLSISLPMEYNLRHKILHGNRKVIYNEKTFLDRKCQIDIFATDCDFNPVENKEVFDFPYENPVF